jgi:DNA-3-methyladenine glycosylase II
MKNIANTESIPPYWSEACAHLIKKDRVMRKLIPQFGEACLQSRGDPFVTLARSVVGQQISANDLGSICKIGQRQVAARQGAENEGG